MENKLGWRKWLSFIMAGLVGQIAWALENMYLSAYAFYVAENMTYISLMVALSAVTATVTTLLMGALSDRLGKRKPFISYGYVIWGITIVIFAFLDPHKEFNIVANTAFIAGTMVVIMDCVMTFFGSTANDACFNAMVTDKTSTNVRGKVESVLSVLPMVSMILIVALSGIFGASVKGGSWDIFFYVIGGLTSLIGIALIFLLEKDDKEPNKEEPYFKNIFYGFRPRVVKHNPLLYILLLGFAVFSMGIQVFFPYLIVYLQTVLEITDMNFIICIGVDLVVASIVTVIIGLFMDKWGKNKLLVPAVLVAAIGAFMFFFAREMVMVIIAGTIMMSGYLVSTAIIGAKIRDLTPVKEVGLFQGIRMVFAVMIPMVTGPYIGQALSYINASTYINEYGETVVTPNEYIFLGTSIILLLSLIPFVILLLKERKAIDVNGISKTPTREE